MNLQAEISPDQPLEGSSPGGLIVEFGGDLNTKFMNVDKSETGSLETEPEHSKHCELHP